MRIAKNELTEYQKQIKYFAEEGYDSKEIAEKVGRTLSSVRSAIAYLKVKGQIDEEKMAVMRASRAKPQTDTLNKYQRQVKELLENGYTIKEIAQKLGKGYECIWHVQNKLKCKGQLDEEKMAMIREEREEAKREYQIQIKELSEEGYTVKEIAQKLGTTLNIIIYNRSILRANGQLDEEKMAMMRAEKAKLKTKTLTEYQSQVKELLEDGYTAKEIAQKLVKSSDNINQVKDRIRNKGKLDEEKIKMKREERAKLRPKTLTKYQKQIKYFCEKGYTQKQIAEKLGRPIGSVLSAITQLKLKGQLDTKKVAYMRVQRKLEKTQRTKKDIFNLARGYLKKRKYEELVVTLEELDENMLEPNEIKTLEDIKDIVKRERSVAEQVETKKTGEER